MCHERTALCQSPQTFSNNTLNGVKSLGVLNLLEDNQNGVRAKYISLYIRMYIQDVHSRVLNNEVHQLWERRLYDIQLLVWNLGIYVENMSIVESHMFRESVKIKSISFFLKCLQRKI